MPPCILLRALFETQAGFFTSLYIIWRDFRPFEYAKTSKKNISWCFIRRHLKIYFMSNFKNIDPWSTNLMNLNLKGKSKIFQNVNIYTSHSTISGNKIFWAMRLFPFATIIVFLTFLGLGLKFCRGVKLTGWGKNPTTSGHSWDSKMCWVQFMESHNSIFFASVYLKLCYNWPLKSQAEINFCGILACLVEIWQ